MVRGLAGLVLLAIVGCASGARQCPTYVASSLAQPFLWRVSGPNSSIIIQATHQAAGADDVSQPAWLALHHADRFVTEADEVQEGSRYGVGGWKPALHLPDRKSLTRMMMSDDFDTLQRRIGAPPHQLARLKPWVAFVLLGRAAYPFPEQTMNAALLDRARQRGMALEFFETWDEQVQYLDAAITIDKLIEAIRDSHRLPCHFTRRIAAFRAGDDAVFANEIGSDAEPVAIRIERWSLRLRQLLERGDRAFVAVGIGHVVGPYGLLARLAALGYRVDRL